MTKLIELAVRCRQCGREWGIEPSGRCRNHGGRSYRGIAAPAFIHGRYSRDVLGRLMYRFLGDPRETPWTDEYPMESAAQGAPDSPLSHGKARDGP